jgi:hypothetical protein
MGDRSSEETAQETSSLETKGNAIKVQMESLVPDLSKITKAKRIKEIVLMRVPFQTETHIFRHGLLLK